MIGSMVRPMVPVRLLAMSGVVSVGERDIAHDPQDHRDQQDDGAGADQEHLGADPAAAARAIGKSASDTTASPAGTACGRSSIRKTSGSARSPRQPRTPVHTKLSIMAARADSTQPSRGPIRNERRDHQRIDRQSRRDTSSRERSEWSRSGHAYLQSYAST